MLYSELFILSFSFSLHVIFITRTQMIAVKEICEAAQKGNSTICLQWWVQLCAFFTGTKVSRCKQARNEFACKVCQHSFLARRKLDTRETKWFPDQGVIKQQSAAETARSGRDTNMVVTGYSTDPFGCSLAGQGKRPLLLLSPSWQKKMAQLLQSGQKS